MVLEKLSWHVTFPNHVSCPLWTVAERSLLAYREADLAPHPVLQVRDAGKFPLALGFESLGHFLRVSKQGPCLAAIDKDRGDKRLVQL